MELNGNGKVVGVSALVGILAVVVTIFIMLQSGLGGSVKAIMLSDREQGERITAVEVELDGIDDKVDNLLVEQRGMREDIKEILQALR